MENNIKSSLTKTFGFKLFMIVTLTIITSGALTYGYLNAERRQGGESSIVAGCFDVSFTEGKSISLENARSMSDASGQRTEPYTFSVTNNCEIETSYTVILSVKNGSIPSKFMSTSINGEQANVLADTLENRHYEVDDSYSESYILASGSIKKDETAKFDLRIWINAIATYEDVKGYNWEGEVKVVNGVKEVEDMKYLGNKLEKIAKDVNPDFTKSAVEDGVYILEDDDGKSYYYRGNTDANYMYFAGMNFRIVRLNGDGTLRIVYDEKNNESDDKRVAIEAVAPLIEGGDDNLYRELDGWYQEKFVSTGYDKFVASANFCEDEKSSATTPTFTCNVPKKRKVGLLSLDEVVAGGAVIGEVNTTFYLARNATFWLGSSNGSESMYALDASGSIKTEDITTPNSLVPVINIAKEYIDMITGDGSLENPYTL